MDNYATIVQEVSKSDIENSVVELKISGQPVREFKSPAIVASVQDGITVACFVGSGPKEILQAIFSMINIYRSTANNREILILGNLLCAVIEDIITKNKPAEPAGGCF
jgi:hypothetical protein